MGKLGKYKYPDILINRAIEITKIISYDFGGSIKRSTLASKLNMSANGGQFSKVINGCKQWKLIEGRSVIKLTENGIIVSNPRDLEENRNVKNRIVRNITFFDEFLKIFTGFDIRDPNFHVYLEEISGATRTEITPKYRYLKSLFEEITDIVEQMDFSTGKKGSNQSNIDVSSQKIEDKLKVPESQIQISFRGVDVKLPDNNESIEAIISLLIAHKGV